MGHFHPDFTKPETDVILESSEAILFHFPMPLLALVSSFFNGLADLPAPIKADAPPPVKRGRVTIRNLSVNPSGVETLKLPLATGPALATTLHLIRTTTTGQPPKHIPKTAAEVLGVLKIADAYDIPIVKLMLSRFVATSAPKSSAFFAYAVASAADDESCAVAMSTRTLDFFIDTMDSDSRTLLERLAPVYFLRLKELHSHRLLLAERVKSDLLQISRSAAKIPDKLCPHTTMGDTPSAIQRNLESNTVIPERVRPSWTPYLNEEYMRSRHECCTARIPELKRIFNIIVAPLQTDKRTTI